MNNPWDSIPLSDYENHMALDSVRQLQTMNDLMADQFARYPVRSAMVLGVAGGNGLEHVDPSRLETVWGVDLNGAIWPPVPPGTLTWRGRCSFSGRT